MAKFASIIFAILLVCMTVVATDAQINCGTVAKSLMPCITYLKQGGAVPPACCNGVRTLHSAANNPSARRTACQCMKSAAKAYGVNPHYAAALPKKCKVNIGYAISYGTDCSKIH
ncbi:hypothetical protein CDL12_05925 [Handroanthus impetiginosus]|uniref:Non-specific lipid-transfer protein n=1 Tax=Handroanthus impetiginosus TaxID=429701 RepID=A0A2G9HVM6_9LAMI|nr:hypothetical protein CDL12_05925 [Handroanthus impetiginosus]